MATHATVWFAFIFELIGGIFLTFISGSLFKRYLDRKNLPPLLLSLAVLSIAFGVMVSGIGRLFAILYFPNLEIFYHGFMYWPITWIALALTLNIIGDIFFLLFVSYVFYSASKKVSILILIIGMILVILQGLLIPMPNLNPITLEPEIFYINLFQIIWMAHALFTFLTGGIIIYSALKFAGKEERPLVEKKGLQMISLLGVGLALTNIMFVIDEFITPYFGGNFSLFYYLGWSFAYFGVIFAYLGFILPNWLRKRWEQ
ncbi:MAG: hypothetical protein ACTSVY_03945 [Candidatus Helarchaeota archaeon]